ncbi:ATP-grasp domain-containing protein [Natronococcus wangiae]|uniref:ATP-grasp domain-containing protein n=1 Tax=Natronococcus wangiae TaxID=3068275 RepID=UPI00273E3C9E|nr:ATP-grasp domain-containing protein [Natronococcus sp. AD5]
MGVLSLHTSKETKAILNAIKALGHEPIWLRNEDIQFYTDGITVDPHPDIDIVVNRLLFTKGSRPLEDLALVQIYDELRPVLNDPSAVLAASHKYATIAALTEADVTVPESFFALDQSVLDEARKRIGARVVQKAAIAAGGAKVWRLEETDSLVPPIGERRTFLQKFLSSSPTRPWDVRAYVVEGEVLGAMKRHAAADEWRTNVARDAEVEGLPEPLPAEITDLATQAAATLGLDYAGVDLIEQDGVWYILEVNATAGFKGLFEATEISIAPYIAQLAIERAGGHVDEEQVETLATTLDDSEPLSNPTAETTPRDRSTVGYTEKVTIGGTTDTMTTTAKADTGTQRTSIDLGLASNVGAGPITGKHKVKSGTQQTTTARPLVDVTIGLRGAWHTVTVSVEDREHMSYPVLLGRDILKHHRIDLQRRGDEE